LTGAGRSPAAASDAAGVQWTELRQLRGVRLLSAGQGAPVVVLPGLEGSGESCLHLVLPVIFPAGAPSRGRVFLVDYAAERHRTLGELTATIRELLRGTLPADAQVTFWGQSFGNLLVALVVQQGGTTAVRTVLVSPFTGLPQVRVVVARASLAVAWRPLYLATAQPVSRFIFGPAPRGTGGPFFRAIAQAEPADVRRRMSWLAGADFSTAFLALPGPTGVWIGEQDRLVDLPRQLAFFSAMTREPGSQLTAIPGSGHVVLPPDSVSFARATVAEWLDAGNR
jgi:pimeloyl-ACP methyl ester carboxylesterase